MKYLFILLQDSKANDVGYDIGYAIGQNLPYVLLLIFAYIIIRFLRKRTKK